MILNQQKPGWSRWSWLDLAGRRCWSRWGWSWPWGDPALRRLNFPTFWRSSDDNQLEFDIQSRNWVKYEGLTIWWSRGPIGSKIWKWGNNLVLDLYYVKLIPIPCHIGGAMVLWERILFHFKEGIFFQSTSIQQSEKWRNYDDAQLHTSENRTLPIIMKSFLLSLNKLHRRKNQISDCRHRCVWRSLRCCRIWSALEVRFSNWF